jgi:hypothetical protein
MAACDDAAAAAAANPLPPPESSSMKMGVLSSTSARLAPGGTVTRLLLLFLFTAPMNASSFSAFSSTSPKLTTSTATLHLRSFLPTETSSLVSASTGEPMNSTMRMRWCLFWRCLSARCATCR